MRYLCTRSPPFHSSVQFTSRCDIYALVHLRFTVQFSVAVETVVNNVGLTDDGPFHSSFGNSVAVETVVNYDGLINDGTFHSSLTTVFPLKLFQRWSDDDSFHSSFGRLGLGRVQHANIDKNTKTTLKRCYMLQVILRLSSAMTGSLPHSKHRFPAPSSRKDVVNQCLDFGSLHESIHPPETDINPPKTACGCPCEQSNKIRSHTQNQHIRELISARNT